MERIENLNENKALNEAQKQILLCLEKGEKSRGELVNCMNKPRTTIYDNLAVLINNGKVVKASRMVNARGRPIVFFKIK